VDQDELWTFAVEDVLTPVEVTARDYQYRLGPDSTDLWFESDTPTPVNDGRIRPGDLLRIDDQVALALTSPMNWDDELEILQDGTFMYNGDRCIKAQMLIRYKDGRYLYKLDEKIWPLPPSKVAGIIGHYSTLSVAPDGELLMPEDEPSTDDED
jgi:hypothetical protein